MQIKLQSDNYHVLLNTLGAELNSYSNPSGNEYVWNSDPTYWLRSSPLLFPTVGNVRNGETVIKLVLLKQLLELRSLMYRQFMH